MSVSVPVAALRVALALRRGLAVPIRRARDGMCGAVVEREEDRRVKTAVHQEWSAEAWHEGLPLPRPGSRSGARARHLREAEAIESWALPRVSGHARQAYRMAAAEADAEAEAAWRRRGAAQREIALARRLVGAPLVLDP